MDYLNADQIKNYISNLNKNTYLVYNLPEEVIATLFAYVSRSSKSLREDILKVSQEKAQSFHEKWVINYGHASIAEMAIVHFGIEKVSRFFSSFLERANLHASFIEYSQRYQKINRGDFYIPPALKDNLIYRDLYKIYCDFQNSLYDVYEQVISQLHTFYSAYESSQNALKKSYEDARYILSLAYYSNLAMTVNARALEELLVELFSSPYEEVNARALEIKEEALKVFPSLIKYAQRDEFRFSMYDKINKYPMLFEDSKDKFPALKFKEVPVEVNYLKIANGFDKMSIEGILNYILSFFYYEYPGGASYLNLKKKLKSTTLEQKESVFKTIFKNFKKHDAPPKAFEMIVFLFEIYVSESCWHQLLRHRKLEIIYQFSSVQNGYILPKSIKRLENVEILFEKAHEKSSQLYEMLKSENLNLEFYSILNMHRKKLLCQISLTQLYHLIQLRMSPLAQSEIRLLVYKLVKTIYKKYAILIEPALKRLEETYPQDEWILNKLRKIREEII